MTWKFEKFYGLFTDKLPTEFLLLLDRSFLLVQNNSTYIELINKQFISASVSAQSVMLTDGTRTSQDQFVIKTDASANAVTIYPFGTQTINGAASYVLAARYNKVSLTFSIDTWYIVST